MTPEKIAEPSLLIIFYRNPELGKVKTRLAASIGDAKAFAIYLLLAEHTREITVGLPVEKTLYYSHYIAMNDDWSSEKYHKHVQSGNDLGERMMHAFDAGFKAGYKSICIIGTDCLELTSTVIEEAFSKLQTYDAVIGPARDGGYYLLGMNQLYPLLFQNKKWSTSAVLENTLDNFKTLDIAFCQLIPLNDVDEERDLPANLR